MLLYIVALRCVALCVVLCMLLCILSSCVVVVFCVVLPSGTGKTSTVIAAIEEIRARRPELRILACAPSDAAADVIAIRLVHAGNTPIQYTPSQYTSFQYNPFQYRTSSQSFSPPLSPLNLSQACNRYIYCD